MTLLEYNRLKRTRKNHILFSKAKRVKNPYPPDLHYLWEFMQEKNIGLNFCLGMIYNLGYLEGKTYKSNPDIH